MADEGFNRLKIWLLGDPTSPEADERLGLLSRKGMSVETLAKGIGVTRTAVYKYLNDEVRPTPENLFKMCVFLGVPLEVGARYCTPRAAGRPYSKKIVYKQYL